MSLSAQLHKQRILLREGLLLRGICDPEADETLMDASKTRLRTLGLKRGQTFDYLFDFGDSWWHAITVEALDGRPDRKKYPRILEVHGESPPQYVYEE